jgi:hypothetical protein
MLVPRYWAESRVSERVNGRQFAVRRFGWSNVSDADAAVVAASRAQEALRRIVSGENLARREPKVPYNGAQGVPIREEIVSEHDDDIVITRNGYGARCLNTPNVLFVDIDFSDVPAFRVVLAVIALLLVGAAIAGWASHSVLPGLGLGIAALLLGYPVTALLRRAAVSAMGGQEKLARRRVQRFVRAHPEAHVRLYRTPAGLRLLFMHRTFDPGEAAVAEYFLALSSDPVYARMCLNQRCFRARVSPKPWRIGVGQHMRPRPGTWPVNPARLPERTRWIEAYEQAALGYASCGYVASLGSPAVNPSAHRVQVLHDELCRATSALPMG